MSLLKTKRFLPLFITQFCGAFNDNLFKNALIVLVVYGSALNTDIDSKILVTIASGLFILPYVLFSSIAGQLADKIEKSKLSFLTKCLELVIVLTAIIGFSLSSIYILLFVLFMLGVQSTLFSPLKYSLIPDHLKKDELLHGNALIEAATFIAILTGTIVGGILIVKEEGIVIVSSLLVIISIIGIISSRYIPKSGPFVPDMKINYNIYAETISLIKHSAEKRVIFLCVLGISWFWFIGSTYFSQFAPFTKEVLRGDETVVTLLLTIFSIGIAIGSMLSHKLLKGEVTPKYVPLGILGITIFSIDLYFASSGLNRTEMATISHFVSNFTNLRIMFDLLMIAVCGGIYIVPLNALLQEASEEKSRARTIAANNVVNAIFMVLSSLSVAILIALGFSIPDIFMIVAIMNTFVALYICKILPDTIIKAVLKFLFTHLFRVEVRGLENFDKAGKRVVIVANHLSYIDPLFVGTFLPESVFFAVHTHTSRKWWVKPIISLVKNYKIDPTNPMATKTLINEVKQDKKLVIYPEGRLTMTGSLMKIYDGPGMIADKADAMILPIRLEGLQYNPLSKLKTKLRMRWFPKVVITIMRPRKINVSDEIKGRNRRREISLQLYDIMSSTMFESSDLNSTIWQSLIEASKIHGRKKSIIEDINRKPTSYKKLIFKSIVVGDYFSRIVADEKRIGLMLPNSNQTVIVFFGLLSSAITPAMLNYSAGEAAIKSACRTAKLKQIITSRKFIEKARLENIINALTLENIEIIYLEDLKEKIKLENKISAYLKSFAPSWFIETKDSDDEAAILFTSGSEGEPKAVVLSHKNLQANRHQLASRIDFNASDKVMNAMPMFHSFGLGVATLLPILSGIKVFLYPSPLHYRIVPELTYDCDATIMFGTDTFLKNYAKYANPYDFYSVRYIFSGAEKLKDETRKTYSENFGIRILEGYGITETSPVLSINTPMHNKVGSVGRLLPAISYKLENVEGIENGKKLIVSGPNIMKGYLLPSNPGVLVPPANNYYDTGDIVNIDSEGYITILGRAKRFAKISGEMVSLTLVESKINVLWPSNLSAVIAVADDKKGEQLILITNNEKATADEVRSFFRENKLSDISIPKKIIYLQKLPLLGSGKTDYQKLKELV